jgi:FKBP-type peptidyl-prolyl cis-trans isomerase FkpA
MTEVTRVPLQPIAKGALTKLWLGVAAAFLAAAGLAWATLPGSIKIETVKAGTGVSPTLEDVVLINYTGKLKDGKVFDQGKQVPNPVAEFVPGFTQAVLRMQRGGVYKVDIPAALGYGAKANGPIPANSDLTFEVELLDFKNRAELEAQMQAMQQMQQMQGGAPGGPLPPGMAPPGMAPPGAPRKQ